jgi:outer membrane protein assembly factor BamB
VHCLDSETGKLHWVYDMKAHMWGSTLRGRRQGVCR